MACLLFIVVNKSLPYFHVGYRDCLAAFFMMMGFWYKRTNWQIEEQKWYLVIPLSLAFVILGTHYWQCGMLTIAWQKLLPYSATALAGILMVFAISRQIVQNKRFKSLLSFIGNNTLEILTWHFLSFKIVSLSLISIYGLPMAHLSEFPVIESLSMQGWWVLYTIIGIALPLLATLSRGQYFSRKE